MSSIKGTRNSSRLVAKANSSNSHIAQADLPKISTTSKTSGTSKRKAKSDVMAPPATPPAKKYKNVVNVSTPEPVIKSKPPKNSKNQAANANIEDRPVEPHMTNAPLLTPHGSKLVRYTDLSADISPSKSGIPKPTTTTGQMLEEACAHLIKTDPKLEPYIKNHHCHVFSAEGLAEAIDPYNALVSGILSQQVSGAAAKSIKRKFIGLFSGNTEEHESEESFPLPEDVAKADVPFLRTAGLSQRKAEYVIGLSEKFASGELTARWLMEASYDEIVEKLVAVRGLGIWSVEMFACFALKRMDVFSLGDLGVQRGVGVVLGRDVKKLKTKGGKWKYATEKEMQDYAEPFAPYRSLLMWYMWKASDTTVEAVENN